MKPKKPTFPIDERYELQLQLAVSESSPRRGWNRSGADRTVAPRTGSSVSTGNPLRIPGITLH